MSEEIRLPLTMLSYDPVTQKVSELSLCRSSFLLGYRGSDFLETGCLVNMYMPEEKTGEKTNE